MLKLINKILNKFNFSLVENTPFIYIYDFRNGIFYAKYTNDLDTVIEIDSSDSNYDEYLKLYNASKQLKK